MPDKPTDTSPTKSTELKQKSPYVFLSHDTKDTDIAKAFSRLLSSVTAGVLKSFRSSDRKSGQGIEYGVEWFPELMKKLQDATDVVCLLTENSLNRPWILFEAGVAKGKLDTPILGLALGIPLNTANAGPFAQFQNSDDEEDSLVKLVIQLVKKIPGAEPDDSVVRQQVTTFKTRLAELLKNVPVAKVKELKKEPEEATSVAKLFEEIKVMFNDLPARLDVPNPVIMRRRRPKRFQFGIVDEIAHLGYRSSPAVGFLIVLSFIKDDMPWLYDLGRDIIEISRRGDEIETHEMVQQFHELVDLTFQHPMFRELIGERGQLPIMQDFEEFAHILHRAVEHVTTSVKKTRKK
jgi:hypothetical protein